MFSFAPLLLPLFVFYCAIPRVECSRNNIFLDDDDDFYGDSGGGNIVGGRPVTQGITRYLWYAKPTIYGVSNPVEWISCGGSLVSPEYVLTAAHCINPKFSTSNPGYYIGALCANDENDNKCNQPQEQRFVDKIFVHPDFNEALRTNDLALVRLSEVSTVSPGIMADNSIVESAKDITFLWAVGFGHTVYPPFMSYNKFPGRLRHARLMYQSNTKCQIEINKSLDINISDDMMCAGAPGKSACNGDSGGPLYDRSSKTIAGVVSWGVNCGERGHPGVHSRISKNYDWIRSVICAGHRKPLPEFCGSEHIKSTCEDKILDSSKLPYIWIRERNCDSNNVPGRGCPPARPDCGADQHLFRINVLTDSSTPTFYYNLRRTGGRSDKMYTFGTALKSSSWNYDEICIPKGAEFTFHMTNYALVMDPSADSNINGLCKFELLLDNVVTHSSFYESVDAVEKFKFTT